MSNRDQQSKINTDLQGTIQALLNDRPVAYHPILAKAVRSSSAGIFLSQLLYWAPRSQNSDGWIWKSGVEITEETALTRTEQETARRLLIKLKVLEERRAGVPARLYFRVNMPRLIQLLSEVAQCSDQQPSPSGSGGKQQEPADEPALQFAENLQTSLRHSHKLDRGKAASKTAAFPQTISESTSETTTENNNTVGVVVVELTEFGISRRTAEQLASRYPEPYILQKLDFVQWLKEQRSSLVAKSPAGYLRRALEEDYQPPPAYKPPAQRQAEATAKHRQLELEQEQRREAEAEFLRTRERARKALAKEYPPQEIPGTNLTTETAWQKTLELLEQGMTPANFQTWLKETRLVACDGSTATIVAPSQYVVEWLATRFSRFIEKQLADVVGHPVATTYLALSELQGGSAGKDQPMASSPPS